jgi:hypothetical protein
MKFLHIYATICVILFTYVATNNNVVHANKIYQRNQVNKHNLVKNLIVSSTNNKQHNSKVDTEGPKVEIPKPTSKDASKLPMAKTDTSTVVAQDKNNKPASTKLSKTEIVKTEETAKEEDDKKKVGSNKVSMPNVKAANVIVTSTTTHGTGATGTTGAKEEPVPKHKKVPPPTGPLPTPQELPLKDYVKWNRPETPTIIQFRIVLQYLFALSQREEMLDIGFKTYRMWNDPRLRYSTAGGGKSYEKEGYEVEPNLIWRPQFEIRNAVEKVVLNEDVNIFPDGTVVYSQRIRAKVTVDFDVGWFPFDAQALHLQYAMFGRSTAKTVVVDATTVDWKPAFPDQKSSTNFLIDSDLAGTTQMSWIIRNFTGKVESLTNEATKMEYKEVMCTLSIQRGKFHYLLVFVAPMIFIVLTGAANFHFDVRDLEPRVQITAALLMSLVALQYSIEQSLPQVSYAIWINWYLFMCYCFLFIQCISFVLLIWIAGPREDGTWTRKPHQEDSAEAQESLKEQIQTPLLQRNVEDGKNQVIVTSTINGESIVIEKEASEAELLAKKYNRWLAYGYPIGFFIVNVLMFSVVPDLLS